MKHYFKALFIFAASMVLAVSCQKKESDYTEMESQLPEIQLILSSAKNSTKAFFDDSVEGETFEKTLSKLSVLVFGADGNILVRRNFTDSELSSKSCTFRVPKSAIGTQCTFTAIANYDIGDVQTYSELLEKLDNVPGDYNGTFSEVTSGAKRADGFVMAGLIQKTIEQMGSVTEVSITLKRTVAKIAFQCKIADDFSTKYNGAVKIDSTKIGKAPVSTRVIPLQSSFSSNQSYSHTQSVGTTEDNKFNSLFYIYENAYNPSAEYVTMDIYATYDIDGDWTTTADQKKLTYDIQLNGVMEGMIERNGYYKINGVLNGPDGKNCDIDVKVADWEVPVAQNVDLGI